MINKTLRRLAVGASAITVLGVVVPLAAATTASAAEATGFTALPATQTVTQGTPATYTATPTPTGATSQNGVYFAIDSTGLAGTLCSPAPAGAPTAGPFTCTVTGAQTAALTQGTHTITIFDDVANTSTFQNSDPNTTVSLTVAGTESAYTVSPSTQTAAQNICAVYTGTAKDSAGNPAAGQSVPLSATQATTTVQAAGSPNGPAFCDPTTVATFVNATPASTQTGTSPAFTDKSTSTAAVAADGTFTFGVKSDLTGTVTIGVGGTQSVSNNPVSATLTVDPGTTVVGSPNTQTQNNDVAKAITLSSTSQNAFAGSPSTYTVTVKNATGDVLGGVQPSYLVTAGADKNVTHTCTVSNGAGVSTCSITPSAATTDSLTTFVEQDNNPPNNATGPNAGEPQATSTITVTVRPSFNTVTSNCAGALNPTAATCSVPASQTSEVVTFTFTQDNSGSGGSATAPSAGQTVNFTFTPAAGESISPASATTDASGNASVTVTHTANTAQNIAVTAALASDSAVNKTVTVAFTAAAASTLTLTPAAQTKAVGSTVTVTATTADQFKAGVSGQAITFSIAGRNGPATNPGATGACTTAANGTCTFSYVDKGAALTGAGTGTDTITATDTTPGGPAATTATVTFVAGTATAAAVTLTPPSQNASTTPAGLKGTTTAVTANVKDAHTNNLVNDTVTFTSTGVGTFVNATTGASLGTTATVATDGSGNAQVFVASSTPGTQTVTAAADGVSSNQASIVYANSQYTPVTPERILDTRSGQGSISTVNGGEHTGPLAPNTLYYFSLASTDVPQNQAAYVFNVTAVHPSGLGNLRIAPACSSGAVNTQVPQTSLVNYQTGNDVANDVVISNDQTTTGAPPVTSGCNVFSLYSAGSSADVVIDFQGFYASNAAVTGTTPPVRVVQTSSSLGGHAGVIAANTSASFTIAGQGGVPATTSGTPARAVAINVTAVNPSGLGNLRIYPDGASVPTTSNINYIPGQDKAAFVVVQLPANGKIDVYSAGSSANVDIDLFDYYPSTSTVVTQTPVRVFDSRSAGVELKNGVPVNVTVAGPGASAGGVPATAQAVLVSLTAVHAADSTGVGNLRAYPAGQATPTVSNINYVSKTTDVANFAIVPVGSNGQISLISVGSNINATVDILGYVPAGS